MRALNKTQRAEHQRIAARLEAAQAEFQSALEEARMFADEIASAIDDYAGSRSDKWQESDAAATYADWACAWQDFDADADFEYADNFSGLPMSPGEL